MAQVTDLTVDGDQRGDQYAAEVEANLTALNTLNSGDTSPPATEAGMLWHDTVNNRIRLRNQTDSAWIELPIDTTTGALTTNTQSSALPTIEMRVSGNTNATRTLELVVGGVVTSSITLQDLLNFMTIDDLG